MAKLSKEQIEFLGRQQIPISQVFDASGLGRKVWPERMKALGMVVAMGVTPCAAAGHTLRTRAGHCVQCGTHNLAFLRRFDEDGFVYVTTSMSHNLTKIGTSTDVASRLENLRSYGYGAASDWKLHFSVRCRKAGRVEFRAHEVLSACRTSRSYFKDGTRVDCQELFICTATQAVDAIKLSILETSRFGENEVPA